MLIQPGEKLHIITRRSFEADARRHFAGKVIASSDALVRVEGHAYVVDLLGRGEFTKRPDLRTRIFSLVDANLVINVISEGVNLDAVAYVVTADNHLVVSDGSGWQLDINEFSSRR